MLIQQLLCSKLPSSRVTVLVDHYQEMLDELQTSNWELATVKSGKFVEAVLKCLWEHVGKQVPEGAAFKAGTIIDQLAQVTTANDTVRLTIPRACRFIYDVASNRGARHDPGEISPNVMDANGVSSLASWVVAELVRYSQAGALKPAEATELVAKLVEKKYPLFEEIEGRVYFQNAKLGARKLALLLLAYAYPARISETELVDAVIRHGESRNNAKLGVSRLKLLIDDDGNKNLRLRAPGLKEAEDLIARDSSGRA
jgi:hypothetical protein